MPAAAGTSVYARCEARALVAPGWEVPWTRLQASL